MGPPPVPPPTHHKNHHEHSTRTLSPYTKQLLRDQVTRLETELESIDLTKGEAAWAAYSAKATAIADIQILIDEVPTLEDA